MPTPITIASLSQDSLTRIFTLVSPSLHFLGEVPFTISHVSKRWRALTMSSPLLWTIIRVTPRSNLDALREVLSRSGKCKLDIHFAPPPTTSRQRGKNQAIHLREMTILLLEASVRWGSINITLQNNLLGSILPLICHTPFPQLHSLQLVQSGAISTILHCGPLVFDSRILSAVKLHGVTIHCLHPSNLSGVTSIAFSATASCIINQELLDTLGGVVSATHPPSMLQLASLSIVAENPSVPLHPTFRTSTLVSLKLGGFCSTSSALVLPFVGIFNHLSSPSLRHLELENIVGLAWDAFLQSLQSTTSPKYPGLWTLTMRSLQLRTIDGSFLSAFPLITHFNLFEVDPSPIVLLTNEVTWHKFTLIVDGKEIYLHQK